MVTSANFPAPDPVPTITPTTTPTAVASTTAAAETQLTSRLLKDGPKPKHAQLREILEEICATELSPGDMLPGERVLEETYGVSRITVRRAIGDLVASGKLKRARGKGTFVAPNPWCPVCIWPHFRLKCQLNTCRHPARFCRQPAPWPQKKWRRSLTPNRV